MGSLAAYLAIKKNRNPIGWFLAGMFFGIFGIVLLFILPPLQKSGEQDNNDMMSSEDGEDDLQYNSFSQLFSPPQLVEETAAAKSFPATEEQWFYLDMQKNNIGPLNIEDLLTSLKNRGSRENINPMEIWVWKKGMNQWEKVKNLPDLRKHFT